MRAFITVVESRDAAEKVDKFLVKVSAKITYFLLHGDIQACDLDKLYEPFNQLFAEILKTQWSSTEIIKVLNIVQVPIAFFVPSTCKCGVSVNISEQPCRPSASKWALSAPEEGSWMLSNTLKRGKRKKWREREV
jgi:hypothetical protein